MEEWFTISQLKWQIRSQIRWQWLTKLRVVSLRFAVMAWQCLLKRCLWLLLAAHQYQIQLVVLWVYQLLVENWLRSYVLCRLVPRFLLRFWRRFVKLDLMWLQLLVALAIFDCTWELQDYFSATASIRGAQRLYWLVVVIAGLIQVLNMVSQILSWGRAPTIVKGSLV